MAEVLSFRWFKSSGW